VKKVLEQYAKHIIRIKHRAHAIVVSSVEERTVRGVGRAHLKLKSMAFLEEETK